MEIAPFIIYGLFVAIVAAMVIIHDEARRLGLPFTKEHVTPSEIFFFLWSGIKRRSKNLFLTIYYLAISMLPVIFWLESSDLTILIFTFISVVTTIFIGYVIYGHRHQIGELAREIIAHPEKLKEIYKRILQPSLAIVILQQRNLLPAVVAPGAIALKLKRSQKSNTFGRVIYVLDARVDVAADVFGEIDKHRLGKRLVYESEARQTRRQAAHGYLMDTAGQTRIFAPAAEQAKGLFRTLWRLCRAGASALWAIFALRITVANLLAGVHIECKSIEELLETEDAIKQATENLKGYIEVIRTFDGQEQLIEF